MKNYSFIINGHKYEVQVKNFDDNLAEVEVNGTGYKVEVQSLVAKPVTKTPTLVRKPVEIKPGEGTIQKAPVSGGTYTLKSPLPGNIFKILVNVGQTVYKDQTVIVMEAMKMENNIQIEKGGVVKEIKVNIGDSVLQNDTLMVIE